MFERFGRFLPLAQSPPQAQPPQQSSGGGFPWGKVLAGCGCLTLVVLLAGGGIAYFAWSKAKDEYDKAKDEGGAVSLLEQLADEGSSGESGSSGSSASGGKDKVNAKKKAREAREDALTHEKLRTYIREPLTMSDVDAYQEFVEEWRDNKAYKNWEKQWKALQDRSKDKDKDSMVGQLKTANQTAKTMQAVQQVWKAYDEHVREHGGYEEHYGRMTRIGGLMAAADAVAKEHKIDDANSDKVAAQMLEQRPEVAEQYEKNVKDAREAAAKARESGNKDAQQMAAMQGIMTLASNPGAVAMARMPEKSFETWDKLSPSERKELRESMKTAIAPGPYFGMAFGGNPGSLLVAAYMSELKEITKPESK
jgi:hypothetical protein